MTPDEFNATPDAEHTQTALVENYPSLAERDVPWLIIAAIGLLIALLLAIFFGIKRHRARKNRILERTPYEDWTHAMNRLEKLKDGDPKLFYTEARNALNACLYLGIETRLDALSAQELMTYLGDHDILLSRTSQPSPDQAKAKKREKPNASNTREIDHAPREQSDAHMSALSACLARYERALFANQAIDLNDQTRDFELLRDLSAHRQNGS